MAKKRVNGEGTIGKRKDGRWEVRYIAGRDPETGKQIRKSILGKTQAEVRTKLKEALAEATEIDVVKSGEFNVAGWVQAWYSLYAQPNVRETTARYYKGYIDHHVLPRLGDIPLNKLTSLDIQQFYKDLLENGRIREDTKLYYGEVNMFDSLEVHDVVLDKLMWEYTKNRINRVFGEDYVQIIDYRMEGYTLKNIAEELGLSASKVSFMFEKVKKWYTTIDS